MQRDSPCNWNDLNECGNHRLKMVLICFVYDLVDVDANCDATMKTEFDEWNVKKVKWKKIKLQLERVEVYKANSLRQWKSVRQQ